MAPNYGTGIFLTSFPLLVWGAAVQFWPRPPHCWGFQTHTHTHTHKQTHTHTHTQGRAPLNEWSSRRVGPLPTQTNRTSMPSTKFEPAIPAVKRLQSARPPGSAVHSFTFHIKKPLTHLNKSSMFFNLMSQRRFEKWTTYNCCPLARHEVIFQSGGIAPLILIFVTRCGCEVCFRFLSLYPPSGTQTS